MAVERTLILIKPDGVERGLVGEIISRFEKKGFRIVGLKMLKFSEELAEKFYSVHRGKGFFNELVNYIASGPVVAMVIEGESAIKVSRAIIGPTDGREAPPGTIRGDYSLSKLKNTVHASDSVDSAAYEISVIFNEHELIP
ncbi:MAG: nucleoside-diphosphate kinase [Sulfolobales archaeon]|nr:nucleoside-diphosphate kinase [Sulfolobales archaeon]MCX8199617.1 nucleoside-diphosphate kinase [Sulfolobales archaeon]MDW8170571.1 nucleoside-diphosphate kinase [Desulfurococcaceae archaeon]